MATYYIVENNQQAGPFTLDQLAAKGITPETNVWTDGMSNWTPASQVSELQSLFAPQPQYAPQPQQYTPQPEPEPQPDYSSSYSSSEEQAPAMPKDWKVPSIILIAASIFWTMLRHIRRSVTIMHTFAAIRACCLCSFLQISAIRRSGALACSTSLISEHRMSIRILMSCLLKIVRKGSWRGCTRFCVGIHSSTR